MKKLFILILILAIVGACAFFFMPQLVYNSTSYVKSFENFVDEVEQKTELSGTEYAEIKKEYIDYSEIYYEKYKDELTKDEKSTILDLKRRYYTTIATIGSEDILEDIKGFVNKTNDFFKSLKTTLEEYE